MCGSDVAGTDSDRLVQNGRHWSRVLIHESLARVTGHSCLNRDDTIGEGENLALDLRISLLVIERWYGRNNVEHKDLP